MNLFDHPSELVHKVDPALNYYGDLGEGGYGIVYLVGMRDERYALKVSKFYDEEVPSLAREFHILKKVEGIEGIPKALNFYSGAFREKIGGVRRLLDCYLMQYVPGKSVLYEKYPGRMFFERLRDIGNQVAERGCTLPADLCTNVLVDNANNPWVIDFMFSSHLASSNRLRRRNRKLVDSLEHLMGGSSCSIGDVILQLSLEGTP